MESIEAADLPGGAGAGGDQGLPVASRRLGELQVGRKGGLGGSSRLGEMQVRRA